MTPPHSIRVSGVLLLIATALAAVYEPLADICWLAFNDPEHSHLSLVGIVIAWVVWERRARLANWHVRHQVLGLVMIATGLSISHGGSQIGIQAAWHVGAVITLLGAVVSAFGTETLRRFRGAVVVAFLFIPIPGLIRQAVAVPVQIWSATATENILRVAGFPVARHGNYLEINGIAVAVVEACNGMRMLFAAIVVTAATLIVLRVNNRTRLLLLIGCPFLIFATNTVRLAATVLLFGYAPAWVSDWFHDIAGWLTAAIVLQFVVRVAWSVSSHEGDEPNRYPCPAKPRVAGRLIPVASITVLSAGAFFAAADRPASATITDYCHQAQMIVSTVPYRIGDYIGSDVDLTDDETDLLTPNASIRRRYRSLSTGDEFELLILHFSDARKLIGHYPPVCYPSQGWDLMSSNDHNWFSGSRSVNGTQYEFTIDRDEHALECLTVRDMILLPTGKTTGDMSEAAALAANHHQRTFGAAQIRVASANPDTTPSMTEILTAIAPVVDTFMNTQLNTGIDTDEN